MKPGHQETVGQTWNEFNTSILIPTGVSRDSVQFQEMRRAYYAGAYAIFEMLQDLSERYSEEQAAEKLSVIDIEFRRFHQDLAGGRA